METQKTNKLKKYLFPGLIYHIADIFILSMRSKGFIFKFIRCTRSKGTVKVKQDKNKNYAIEVDNC
jgi:hypothetical protein